MNLISMHFVLMAVFVVLQALDIYTTLRILKRGGRELNPVMRWLFDALGVKEGLIVTKAALVLLFLFFGSVYITFIGCIFYIVVVSHNFIQMRKQ